MNPQLKARLESLRNQAILYMETPRKYANGEPILGDIIRDALGNFTANIVRNSDWSGIISPRKSASAMKKFLKESDRKKLKEMKKQREFEMEYQVKILVDQAKSVLKEISIPRQNIPIRGNSQEMLKMLENVYKYATPERRLQEFVNTMDRIISLEPIENREIADYLNSLGRTDEVITGKIKLFEERIRSFLKERLNEISKGNGTEMIPILIKKQAVKRMEKEDSKHSSVSESRNIFDFLSFSDYVKIISDDRNWELTFHKSFPTRSWIQERFEEITNIRNAVMHSRKVSKREMDKLNIFVDEILETISK